MAVAVASNHCPSIPAGGVMVEVAELAGLREVEVDAGALAVLVANWKFTGTLPNKTK